VKERDYISPNRESGDSYIKGGDYLYRIEVYPATSLMFRPRTPSGHILLDSLSAAISDGIQHLVDSRSKAVVWRLKRNSANYTFPIVKIEFLPSLDEAKMRREELLGAWDFSEYEAKEAIPKREARQMRRETRRATRAGG